MQLVSAPIRSDFLLRTSQIEAVELYNRMIDSADNPKQLIETMQAVDAQLPNTGGVTTPRKLVLCLFPSFSRAGQLHARAIGALRSTKLALACERFRLRHGQFPESIEQLVPDFLDAVPLDPFDEAPLRFRATDEGVVIYTIGEDLTDDGGSLRRREGEKQCRDFGFELLRPELRGVKIIDVEPPADD